MARMKTRQQMVCVEIDRTRYRKMGLRSLVPQPLRVEQRRPPTKRSSSGPNQTATIFNPEFKDEKKGDEKKGKKKKDEVPTLPPTIYESYLSNIGHFHVGKEVVDEMNDMSVGRIFMRDHYGGAHTFMFPDIDRKKHKHRHHFLYPPLRLNPHAPQLIGAPGILISPDNRPYQIGWHDHLVGTTWKVFTGFGEHKDFRYMGDYKASLCSSLVSQNWRLLDDQVRKKWVNTVLINSWAKGVRVRVWYRINRGRKPTQREFNEAYKSKNEYKDVRLQDLEDAYLNGTESMMVVALKCVNFDVDFAREVKAKLARPYIRRNVKVEDREVIDLSGSQASDATSARKKRKPCNQNGGQKHKRAKTDPNSVLDRDGGPQYVPRGTKSRPLKG